MMKTVAMLVPLAALAFALPIAAAEPQTRTRTSEGPRVSATQTTTADREAGTVTANRTATDRRTGATGWSSAVLQRTETGATFAAEQTGPQGKTRSLEGERTRTENGATFTGTATGADGQTYGLYGSRSRDGQGNSTASQRVTNATGETLAARERVTSRGSTSISRTPPQGMGRMGRGRGPR